MSIQIFETNVLRLMEDQDLNKLQLSRRAGIAIAFPSDLTHRRANPTLKTMAAIADALGVSLPYMLEATDLPPDQLTELHVKPA